MKLKIKVGELASAIKLASTEHTKSNAIPSFQNINLKEVDGKLQVSVIDGLLAIRTIATPISIDSGFACAVDLEKFGGVISKLDNSAEVTVTQKDDNKDQMYSARTLINCGKSKFEMASNYDSEINVPIPDADEFEDIVLNARDFIIALKTGLPFLEKESSAVESMAFYFILKFNNNELEIFTGGGISNRSQLFKNIKCDTASVALSRKILNALDAAFKNDSQIKLRISDKKSMFFTDKTTILITNQSFGIKNNTRGLYATEPVGYITVKKESILSCISRVIGCSDSKSGLFLSVKNGKLIVDAKDLDKQIAAQEEVDLVKCDTDESIAVVGDTLSTMITVAAEDEIQIKYIDRGNGVTALRIDDIDSDGNVYNTLVGLLRYE